MAFVYCTKCGHYPVADTAPKCPKCGMPRSPQSQSNPVRPIANLPSNVARFEQLMYLSVALGLLQTLLQWNKLAADTSRIGGTRTVVFILLYLCGFLVLFIWLAAREHKSWARWVLLIFFAVSIPAYFPRFDPNAGINLPDRILNFGQFLSQGIALVLIFSGNARNWFERPAQ
jgi:uncharacterized membrane protein